VGASRTDGWRSCFRGARVVPPGELNHFYLEGDWVLQVKPFVHREGGTVGHLCGLLSQNESVSVQPYYAAVSRHLFQKLGCFFCRR